MTEFSVHQWIESKQSGFDTDWEETSYREGCAYAREKAITRLRALDDELAEVQAEWLDGVGIS